MSHNKIETLMPNGIPRYIRCYDNGGATADRYTIVFTKRPLRCKDGSFQEWGYLSASCCPFHPQGIGLHGFSQELIDKPTYKHLGKKVKFETLPTDVKSWVMQEYMEHWEINPPQTV